MKKKEINILIIEDDFSHYFMIKTSLKYALDNEIFVDNALKLNEALALMEKNKYDIIVCDLYLPYSNILLNTINTVANNKKNALLVFCSAKNVDTEILDAISSNNWIFLKKGTNFSEELKDIINKHYN